MAYWGSALVLGPNLNAGMSRNKGKEAFGLVKEAIRELDDETIRRAALITVDDLPQAQAESGELMAAAARGVLQWERVREMADVVAGSISGRADAQAITLFESQGIATWDVAAAMVTYRAARERGVGVEVAL